MESAFAPFLQLLRGLRAADTADRVYFAAVNDLRRVLPYSRAVLLRPGSVGWQAVAVSGATRVDRAVPFIGWLEKTATTLVGAPTGWVTQLVSPDPAAREAHGLGSVLWLPLPASLDGSRNGLIGALWLERAEPWHEGEALFLTDIAEAVAHALRVVEGERRGQAASPVKAGVLLVLALVVAAMCVPIQRRALAPAEIVPRDAEVVTAPIDGVIRSFSVRPNQRVAAGDVLFSLDDTERQARLDVALKALDVARVEYRQASQGALGGRRDGPKLASLEAQIALKEIEVENMRQQLERTRARAVRDGVALLPDVQEYIGRPVNAGERVLLIADPAETEARAWLGVRDILPVADGAAVRLFLDADPLHPLDGKVTKIHHEAEETPGNGLAYRVSISLDAAVVAENPLIGARGTARIDGDQAALFLYLFRRPIAAVRQAIGF